MAATSWRYMAWPYVVVATYVMVGILAYSEWWKRFLTTRSMFDRRFWRATLESAPYPVIFVVTTLAVVVFGWTFYRAGQTGGIRAASRSVKAPPAFVVFLTTLLLGASLIGLAFVQETFRTTDDLFADLHRQADDAIATGERFLAEMRTKPPESGFFIYMNAPELGRTYNALQKDLTMALETSSTEKGKEQKASISLKTISGEVVERDRVQRSVQMVPTAPTPERQAVWLIRTYNDLKLALEAYQAYSFGAPSIIRELAERGVTLTDDQKRALFDGDVKLLYTKFGRTNVPIIYAGKLRLSADPKGFRIETHFGDAVPVHVVGTGDIAQVEQSIRTCLQQKMGCELDAKLLGIVWRSEQQARDIVLSTVPLAIW